MAEVHILSSRIGPEGAHRLFVAQQDDLASGRDLGPRGTQIRAPGLSLEHASQHLRCEVERIRVGPPTEDPDLSAARIEMQRWRDELLHLADSFRRLGVVARSYRV